jgi:hypothetical protein
MREVTMMNPSKETDNKLRWSADVDGVIFHLYIPKWRVPAPWPVMLEVLVGPLTASPAMDRSLPRPGSPELERPIVTTMEMVMEHTQTVRYRPIGDPKSWEMQPTGYAGGRWANVRPPR